MRPITLACILTCITLTAGPASALDLSVGASANAGANAGSSSSSTSSTSSTGLSINAGASVSADANTDPVSTATEASAGAAASASAESEDQLSVVIRLIGSSRWNENSFANFTEVNAEAYDLDTWVNSNNEAELNAALDANAEEIGDLHAALDANATFSAWLDEQGVESSDVVAVGVTADGSLAVFTN